MAAVLVDPTEMASFDNFLSDTDEAKDFKNLMYSNPRYMKHIQVILPWLLNRGALELLWKLIALYSFMYICIYYEIH